MITTPRSSTWQGLMAGAVTFAVMMVPTVAIVYAAGAGTVGSVSTSGFGAVAAVVLPTGRGPAPLSLAQTRTARSLVFT